MQEKMLAKTIKLPILVIFFCSMLLPAASAEEDINRHELDKIVITATRTERKTEEIPAGVSVLTEEDLKTSRLLGVKEALTGLSGVQSETRNGGYDARLLIRGSGLKARYGVREIMVLLDGVPITDPDGMTRLDFVDSQLIQRVDVVKGPNSTLYGANAAGGVVNIITKTPYEETKSIKAGYGSYHTQLYNVIYGNNIASTYFALTGTKKSTKGWRDWNEFDSNQVGVKAGHLFEENASVELGFNYTQADLQLPGTLSKEQFDEDITQTTDEPFRHSSRDSEIYSTSLKAEKSFGPLKLRPLAYFQTWEHFHPVPGAINDGGAKIYGADIQGDLEHSAWGAQGLLTAGVTVQVDKSEREKFKYRDIETIPSGRITATLSDEKGELAETTDDTVTKWGVFVQESLRPTDKWIVDLGMRFDQVFFDISGQIFTEYSYSAGNYVAPEHPIINVDERFDRLSPRLGVIYKVNDIYNLYGNVSTGFQTPQSSELEDNSALDPATTINYETGVKARLPGGHSLDLSVFYMDLTDEIVLTRLGNGDTSYSNAGESIRKGVELAAQVQLWEGLSLGGAYTYSNFKYEKFDEPIGRDWFNRDGNYLPYIPKHQYSLYAQYQHRSGFICKVDTHSWGEYYVDNANSEKYSGYDLLTNAFVGWETRHWDISVDVSNVFDKHYAMEVTKDSSNDLRFRPGAPRTLFGKIAYKF